jgi:uncharacterized protein
VWYEWDDAKNKAKNQANLAKHGLVFEAVLDFAWPSALEFQDERFAYGEARWIAIGFIGSRLCTLVYMEREKAVRVISLRASTPRERRAYEEKNGKT